MEVKQAFEYFNLLENQFWSALDESTIKHITYEGDLKPQDMLLYGEFGFALIGLKPSVLVEFRDPAINLLYLETVIQPVLFALKEKTLNYHTIKDIKTPESDLNGCILIYSIAMATNLPELSIVLQATRKFISEDTMAVILDYPGHLPRSEREIPTMKSVIYFSNKPNVELIALTSFAVQDSEKEATLSHFKRYFTTCKEKLGIDLKLLIQ
ncbi:hypothetical protein EDC94DRAFT_621151 [Helicostylum pulchrum]|nr:hypothetical protein EDC94DRAFT_621151 [Helicostylum pulchrum]